MFFRGKMNNLIKNIENPKLSVISFEVFNTHIIMIRLLCLYIAVSVAAFGYSGYTGSKMAEEWNKKGTGQFGTSREVNPNKSMGPSYTKARGGGGWIDNGTPNKEQVKKKYCGRCHTEISIFSSSRLCSGCEARKRADAQRRR